MAYTSDQINIASKKGLRKKERLKRRYKRFSLDKTPSSVLVEPIYAIIRYGSGEVEIEVGGDAHGIQLEYAGNLTIKSNHMRISDLTKGSGGWVMVANNYTGKLLYFNFNGKPINGKKHLFSYRGNVSFTDVVVSGLGTELKGTLESFPTDKFKDIGTAFNKLEVKFKNLKRTGRTRGSNRMETGYESIKRYHNPRKPRKTDVVRRKIGKTTGGGY